MLKKLLFGSVAAVFLLSGCGNTNETNGKDKQSVEKSSATMTPKNPLGFYEDSKENERVWLYVYAEEGVISKDNSVNKVVVTKDSKMTTYSLGDMGIEEGKDYIHLSDIQDKSEKELIELGKEADRKLFEKEKAFDISQAQTRIDDTTENLKEPNLTNDKKSYNEKNLEIDTKLKVEAQNRKYEEPEAMEITLGFETDATGNNVIEETIYTRNPNSTEPREQIYEQMIPLQVFTIYDNHYSGFFVDEDYDRALITSSKEKYVGEVVTKLDDKDLYEKEKK